MESKTTTKKEIIKKWIDKGFRYAYSYKRTDTLEDALSKKNVATSSKMALDTAFANSTYDTGTRDHEIKCWDLQTEFERL